MPLIKSIYPDKTSLIAIWKMEESLDELLEAVTIKDAESEKFNSLIHENRKKEFLAVRLCLKVVTGDDNLLIRYNELNKPDIPGEYYISISHTGDYVAIYLDKSSEVGIDIEQLHERVKRIASRFLSEEEKSRIPEGIEESDADVKWLNLHWSAKETLYKVYAKKRLVFSTQMEIETFTLKEAGIIHGLLKLEEGTLMYPISYVFFEDFVLTYCTEHHKSVSPA